MACGTSYQYCLGWNKNCNQRLKSPELGESWASLSEAMASCFPGDGSNLGGVSQIGRDKASLDLELQNNFQIALIGKLLATF